MMGVMSGEIVTRHTDDGGWYGVLDGRGAFNLGDDGEEFQRGEG